MGLYDAWKSKAHVEHFDLWSRVPLFVLQDRYERFNEVQLLNAYLRASSSPCSLLEVGCATGEFYRYLKSRHPNMRYTGCDISEVAIKRANAKFQAAGAPFILTDESLGTVASIKPDVVFCRDVILHQPDPYVFLQRLYTMAGKLLILRLRTRDVGPTESDPQKSCQLNYGQWAPYMILNCKELLGALHQFSPLPSEIVLRKHYMVLGGHHLRYLPKDCYLDETKTAESALLVAKGSLESSVSVTESVAKEELRLHPVNRIIARLYGA